VLLHFLSLPQLDDLDLLPRLFPQKLSGTSILGQFSPHLFNDGPTSRELLGEFFFNMLYISQQLCLQLIILPVKSFLDLIEFLGEFFMLTVDTKQLIINIPFPILLRHLLLLAQ